MSNNIRQLLESDQNLILARPGIELNGLANMHLLIDDALEMNQIDTKIAAELKDQLDILERYMCSLREAQNGTYQFPTWMAVRENRHLFPNNRGQVKNHVHNKSGA